MQMLSSLSSMSFIPSSLSSISVAIHVIKGTFSFILKILIIFILSIAYLSLLCLLYI
ncbi:hypothetical protein SARI_00914 [Salmonella enterica subsp. arizonae serovar 62:z4,z23:-]|uniref:Uncharacterized protein n=1 Tax=Salmonella arizonae (strain ATCC BAA-731 / CDC346-86 / RSK2980) TaxID=41514 RepID=A9MLW5_SALAR|nr:hypothetical protein SARI_00914 [Salmonella enterica subsp. arizonae serovar 62:z4,z23:-]